MIGRGDIQLRAREWGLRDDVVEKDYVLGWTLWGVGSDPALTQQWAFKGGTCLKKCYLETYRFSEDLDFTVLTGGTRTADDILSALRMVLDRITEASGIDFSLRAPVLRLRPDARSYEGRLYYRGPRGAPDVASVKIDLSLEEAVARPPVLRPIAHPYPDELPGPATVRAYSFEEVFAEKIRAMGERGRPRDLYDIVNLFWRHDLRSHGPLVRETLARKCASKGVPFPTFAGLEAAATRVDLETEWRNMLGHQLPSLPPFAAFWSELPALFAWLDGDEDPEQLASIPGSDNEDPGWTAPPTIAMWGGGAALESIRFAAANRLGVELGYEGSVRIIEPYSLRRTRDGFILLHALRADTRAHRSYRLDRITSVRVTTQPYRPVYLVELSASGSMFVPRPSVSQRRSASSRATWKPYVLECPTCGRHFRRASRSTDLRKHNDRHGDRCHGRRGYHVN